MINDSIHTASIPMASSNPKELVKKKRVNRSAKLKQCKLDARREQWLSQVKNKGGCKEEVNGVKDARDGPLVNVESEREREMEMEKLDIKQRGGQEVYGNVHYSDSDFTPSNSPTSHASSSLGSKESGVSFPASSRSGSSRSSSSISNYCYSESVSEEDEGGCLDDWEAVADALAAADVKQQSHSEPPSGKHSDPGVDVKTDSGGVVVQRTSVKGQAWRPDDAFRPQSLPNLSKQYSFPCNSERHFGRGGSVWDRNSSPIPTSCPICCEDLDCTDSSFLPCLCGFRLCLFCHKRILEQDARCPGCRKKYECETLEGEATLDGGSLTIRLARSSSMITRA